MMNPNLHVQHFFLFVGLAVLPLLLPALMLGSGMAHSLWFYLVALTIFGAGLTASIQLARGRSHDRPAHYASLHHPLAGSLDRPSSDDAPPPYSVLLSAALPSSGVELLRIARALAPPEQLRVAALHLWPEDEFRKQAFERWRASQASDVPEPLRLCT